MECMGARIGAAARHQNGELQMAVGSISNGSAYVQSSAQSQQASALRQRRQDFQALSQALGAGDLPAAKTAFATLQRDLGSAQGSSNQPGNSGTQDKFRAALQAIGQALTSGDLSGAQNAFASLQQARGHHHHRDADADNDGSKPAAASGAGSAAGSAANSPASIASGTAAVGSRLDVTA
jgi:hypothetical protein